MQEIFRKRPQFAEPNVGVTTDPAGTLLVSMTIDEAGTELSRVIRYPFGTINQIDVQLSAGNDQLIVETGAPPVQASGGAGDDLFVMANTNDDTLEGGGGNDSLFGGGGTDVVSGGAGDDLVHGGGRNDVLSGGPGADIIQGRGVNSLVEVLPDGTQNFDLSEDSIPATIGSVEIDDNDLNNVIITSSWARTGVFTRGGGGRDTLIGTHHDDRLEGGAADDRLLGLGGDDEILGEAGDDALLGHDGRDLLIGADGNGDLFGNRDRDTLSGGPGDDRLNAANGSILLKLATGADPVVLDSVSIGNDTIETFVRGILLQGDDEDNPIDASRFAGPEPVTIKGGGGGGGTSCLGHSIARGSRAATETICWSVSVAANCCSARPVTTSSTVVVATMRSLAEPATTTCAATAAATFCLARLATTPSTVAGSTIRYWVARATTSCAADVTTTFCWENPATIGSTATQDLTESTAVRARTL